MDPPRLDRVEPGAFLGQQTTQDTHTLTILFDLPIMFTDPNPCRSTDMPGSMIPDQDQHRFPGRLQSLAAPGEKMLAQDAIGITFDKPQSDGFFPGQLRTDPAYQQTIASQRFGTRIVFHQGFLQQAQWVLRFSPAVQVRLFQTAPPGFVFECQCR